MTNINNPPAYISLLSGGSAGLAVDLSLYPLDTVKTRLQSSAGFFKSGGFKGIYSGLPAVAIGSVPGAGIFFLTYDTIKKNLTPKFPDVPVHMFAAACGEVAACLVRVPVEVVKQRTQVKQHSSSWKAFTSCIRQEGPLGIYRGYWSTVVREIPFSLLQFPIWEYLKVKWSTYQGAPVDPWQGALCGCLAGGFSAGVTTPLDVAKTRIMLAQEKSLVSEGQILYTLKSIIAEKGLPGLFAGFGPRVIGISLGGAIFFGAYEESKSILSSR